MINPIPIFRQAISYIIVTLITLLLVWLSVVLPVSLGIFNLSQDIHEQHNLTDAYYAMDTGNGNHNTDPIIVFGLPEEWDRLRIARFIGEVADAQPDAIGIDIFFNPNDTIDQGDIQLAKALQKHPNTIVVENLTRKDSIYENYRKKNQSYFQHPRPIVKSGYSNVFPEGLSNTVRTFNKPIYFNDTLQYSFPVTLIRTAYPEKFRKLQKRNHKHEYINYKKGGFEIYNDTTMYPEIIPLLKNKAVLIGTIHPGDMHASPRGAKTPGLHIQAYTLATMTQGNYVNYMSLGGAWLLAFIAIMLLLIVKSKIPPKSWVDVFFPLIQFVLIIISIFIAYCIFILFDYYINFIYTLIGIGLAGFADDLYSKLSATLKNKLNSKKHISHEN